MSEQQKKNKNEGLSNNKIRVTKAGSQEIYTEVNKELRKRIHMDKRQYLDSI